MIMEAHPAKVKEGFVWFVQLRAECGCLTWLLMTNERKPAGLNGKS